MNSFYGHNGGYDRLLDRLGTALGSVRRFVDDNRDDLTVFVPLGVAALGFLNRRIRNFRADRRFRNEQRLKERFIYDFSGRHYWEMRRKPTAREWIEIDHRRRSGESLGSILNDLRLI